MKIRVKKHKAYAWALLICLLAGILTEPAAVGLQNPVYAAEVNSETKDSLDRKMQEAQKAVDQAEDSAQEAKGYVDDLESQANEVASLIESTQAEIDRTSSDVSMLQEELAEAGAKEDEQYQAMKLRIKYLYEEGTDNIWVILLTAQDFSDFLNRFEYAASVSKYDSDMITEYQQLQDTITEKTTSLSAKQQELSDNQNALELQKNQLSDILAAAGENLQGKYSELSEAKDSLAQVEAEISEFQQALKAQEAADASNKAAQAQALAAQIEAQQSAEAQAAADAEARLQAALEAEKAAQAARDEAQRQLERAQEAANQNPTSDEAQQAVEDAKNNLEQADNTLRATKESTAAAQAEADAAARKISNYTTTNPKGQVGSVYYVSSMSYSQRDLDELTTIIYCESGNQTYNVQLAVASVILNRVRSSWFSQNTIHDVIFASGQFEPTWLKTKASGDKTFFQYIYDQRSTLLASNSGYQTARQAALDVLSGKRNTNLCFFWSASVNSHPAGSVVYGDLVFFGRVVQLY